MSNKRLLVIGAGPKALAIVAKSAVLRKLGIPAPYVHVIEKSSVGSNWSETSEFTNGKLQLGTSPEKDIGFPYNSRFADEDLNQKINREMFQYSWQSYLIETQQYGKWIDKSRPAPTHKEWSQYLKFVSNKLREQFQLSIGEVISVNQNEHEVHVHFRDQNGNLLEALGDGIVFTGPGIEKKTLEVDLSSMDKVLSLAQFWNQFEKLEVKNGTRIAVIGAGENSASVVVSLLKKFQDKIFIDIISPSGFIFSRGEGYHENRVYTEGGHANWRSLSLNQRQNFVRRTDLSVYSQSAMQAISQSDNVNQIAGRANQVRMINNTTTLSVLNNNQTTQIPYDLIVCASGHDQYLFLEKLLSEELMSKINFEELIETVQTDLSLPLDQLKIHVPMLSGIAQGPGFSNLSSLGHLADAILKGYIHE